MSTGVLEVGLRANGGSSIQLRVLPFAASDFAKVEPRRADCMDSLKGKQGKRIQRERRGEKRRVYSCSVEDSLEPLLLLKVKGGVRVSSDDFFSHSVDMKSP